MTATAVAPYPQDVTPQREAELVEEFLPLVRIVALSFRPVTRHHYDEMFADGSIGLLTAIRRFDPERGASLRTFAFHHIRGAIIDGTRRMNGRANHAAGKARLMARYLALDAPVSRDTDSELLAHEVIADPSVDVEGDVVGEAQVAEWLSLRLEPRDRFILDCRVKGMTEKEIGDELGVTESRVCQLIGRLAHVFAWLERDAQ